MKIVLITFFNNEKCKIMFFSTQVVSFCLNDQLTIKLVNMILSSTQQIASLFNLISAVSFFSSQEIGLLQYAIVLPT